MNPTVIFFFIYGLMASAAAFASYLIGSAVERSFGSQISLICFLVLFMTGLIASFPLSAMLTPDDGSRPNDPDRL